MILNFTTLFNFMYFFKSIIIPFQTQQQYALNLNQKSEINTNYKNFTLQTITTVNRFCFQKQLKQQIRDQFKTMKKLTQIINLTFLVLCFLSVQSYIDLPLTISRSQQKTGEIAYNFVIDVSGYQQNISLSLSTQQKDSITSVSDMKNIYKEKKLKKGKSNLQKNHKNVFGLIEATSLEGYTFEGWRRYFMEAFLYIQSRYYHDIEINLDQFQDKESQKEQNTIKHNLTNGVMTLGPKLKDNKIYQEIKKNTDFVNFNIFAIYSGVGQRNNRLQLGGYEEEYAKGDFKTGALLYEFPLKVTDDYWQVAVEKVLFTRSKNKVTDEFLINPSLSLYKLSLQSEYIIFPQSMRNALQTYVQSQNNECKIEQFLQCKNMSTIDISLSEFAFQLTPNYFINISLYDLRRQYDPQTKKVSFYIKLSSNISQIQIGSSILKEYYIAIDMDQQTLLYSPINRFGNGFSSIYVLRFFVYFIIFTLVMAIFVGIWASMSDPDRRNKIHYGREGIQLITYQRPGGILTTNNQLDD